RSAWASLLIHVPASTAKAGIDSQPPNITHSGKTRMLLPNVLPYSRRAHTAVHPRHHYQMPPAVRFDAHRTAAALRAIAPPEPSELPSAPVPQPVLRCSQPEPPAPARPAGRQGRAERPVAPSADRQLRSDCTDEHPPERPR